MTEAQRCSGELVVFSLDLDVKQSFVICAVSPGLLQELDVAIFKLAADGLFKLSPAYLFVGLLLLGSLVNRLEAGLHTQSDGTSWTGIVVGIGPDLNKVVLSGREELVACCAYVEEERVRWQQGELFFRRNGVACS
jgi:hypothetical protein